MSELSSGLCVSSGRRVPWPLKIAGKNPRMGSVDAASRMRGVVLRGSRLKGLSNQEERAVHDAASDEIMVKG